MEAKRNSIKKMQKLTLLFLILSLGSCAPTISSPPPPSKVEAGFQERTSGIQFPSKGRIFTLTDVHHYDNPNLGVSVRYEAGGGWYDVFVFPAPKGTKNGAYSPAVIQHFNGAREAVLTNDKNAKPFPTESVATLGIHKTSPLAQSAAFIVSEPKIGSVYSQLYVTAFKGQFIKLRTSIPTKERAYTLKLMSFGDFIASLMMDAGYKNKTFPNGVTAKTTGKNTTISLNPSADGNNKGLFDALADVANRK